jgi:hypothetical protein
MRYRRTQLGSDIVSAERRHHNRGERAGHHRQKHAATLGRSQRAAEDDDRQHGPEGELQTDRLVYQRQSPDDNAISSAACQRDGAGPRECQRHGEQRQSGRTE